MLFNSYSYEILYEQFHWIYPQGDIKLLLITVNNRLKFKIEIVHDLSCHPVACYYRHWHEAAASVSEVQRWISALAKQVTINRDLTRSGLLHLTTPVFDKFPHPSLYTPLCLTY